MPGLPEIIPPARLISPPFGCFRRRQRQQNGIDIGQKSASKAKTNRLPFGIRFFCLYRSLCVVPAVPAVP
jgi:hypothetical protein